MDKAALIPVDCDDDYSVQHQIRQIVENVFQAVPRPLLRENNRR